MSAATGGGMGIKRFNAYPLGQRNNYVMLCESDGDYVTHADHEAALQELLARNVELERIAGYFVNVPEDILALMMKSPVCGGNRWSIDAGKLGGCGEEITDPRQWYRCYNCEVTFHKNCLRNHCALETAELERIAAEYRKSHESYSLSLTGTHSSCLNDQFGDTRCATCRAYDKYAEGKIQPTEPGGQQ